MSGRCLSSWPLVSLRAGFRIPLQPLQAGAYLRRALIAQIPIFLEGLVNDFSQVRRSAWIQVSHRKRLLVQDGFLRLTRTQQKVVPRSCSLLT
jgi:hypothetical protein